ncbi:MAG: alpha/beta hydrolase-fold protein [Deltaproteobacteria bacterium]|nr:alpha/beta hydrolase-fold protein [Deltaproteobacteria bacterium]
MADVSSLGDGNFKVGPDFPIDPDLTDKGAPQGQRFEFTMESRDSHIFRGEDLTLKPEHQHPFSRKIFVYVPATYKDGTRAPFLIVHDGPGPLGRMSRAVDNLSTSKDPNRRLPALVLIAVANGGSDSKGSERGLEYDTMSPRLANFINDEVVPAVLANPEIRAAYPKFALTDDPWGRGAFGCSSGGAAALSMAWFRPDLFRRVIAYSATLVDQQDDDAPEEATYPLGAWEYHSGGKLIETTPRKPLRVFVHASEHDLGATSPEEKHHNWPMANERTAAALQAAGYHYRYVFSLESKHCDDRVFDLTMADTLVWAWRGYTAPQ